jgi:hypothetical protein
MIFSSAMAAVAAAGIGYGVTKYKQYQTEQQRGSNDYLGTARQNL